MARFDPRTEANGSSSAPSVQTLNLVNPASRSTGLQDHERAFGYVRGMEEPAPAVVSLNGTIASVALNEFAIYTSGLRPISHFLDLDLLGTGRSVKSQWLTPREVR
ncbi:MAG TPA: hypothetical protein VEN95_00620 [Actinomycetota bacterium]|nr:hypothetical protein [Actinomycetota bacterium]